MYISLYINIYVNYLDSDHNHMNTYKYKTTTIFLLSMFVLTMPASRFRTNTYQHCTISIMFRTDRGAACYVAAASLYVVCMYVYV